MLSAFGAHRALSTVQEEALQIPVSFSSWHSQSLIPVEPSTPSVH